jgi:hypothetical protein
MRHPRSLVLTAVLAALWPLRAHGQNTPIPVFVEPYQYSDAQGPGTMTFAPGSSENTLLRYQPISVVLVQRNGRFTGAGVYHSFADDNAGLAPITLVAFTLQDHFGRAYFFQGTIAAVNGFTGQGTYWRVGNPGRTFEWKVQTVPPTAANALVNGTPVLTETWARNMSSEAIGGVYYGSLNTASGARNTATWSGTLPAAGSYRVEVFIPRQPVPSVAPRTAKATYQITVAGAEQPALKQVDQAVTFSGWVDLGTYSLPAEYRVVLTDETGETAGTRSVVANAVRLTPVQ